MANLFSGLEGLGLGNLSEMKIFDKDKKDKEKAKERGLEREGKRQYGNEGNIRCCTTKDKGRGFGTDYTNYFGLRHGNYGRIDESEFLSDNKFVYKDYISHICHTEWGRDYYCLGAEWFNIISPLQQVHLPTLLEDAKIYPQISTKKLSGGGIAVHLKK